MHDTVAALVPFRRQVNDAEVAEAVVFPAPDKVSFMTGVDVDINGRMFFS